MKKIMFFSLALLAVLFITAVVTCPSRQQHHEVLKGAMDEAMSAVIKDQAGDDESVLGFGLSAIGTTLGSKLIENVVESTLTVHDYLVVSTGEVTVAGKTKTVSIGCFGHVFPTFSAEDVKKAVNGDDDEE